MNKYTTKCYLFDLDGTLFDCQHRIHHIKKHPKDWSAFFKEVKNDTVIEHIRDLADMIYMSGRRLVYVSGRSEECRQDTLDMLRECCPPGPLYMRKQGDHRQDDVIKLELLAQIREDGYEPVMVFDDRSRVVRAWRSVGIPCLQVADGDF
jgi:phosphoglycolate phosphatase-like HAD superfamily hydrolase